MLCVGIFSSSLSSTADDVEDSPAILNRWWFRLEVIRPRTSLGMLEVQQGVIPRLRPMNHVVGYWEIDPWRLHLLICLYIISSQGQFSQISTCSYFLQITIK